MLRHKAIYCAIANQLIRCSVLRKVSFRDHEPSNCSHLHWTILFTRQLGRKNEFAHETRIRFNSDSQRIHQIWRSWEKLLMLVFDFIENSQRRTRFVMYASDVCHCRPRLFRTTSWNWVNELPTLFFVGFIKERFKLLHGIIGCLVSWRYIN